MSWRDRPYSGDAPESELRIHFPRPGTAVTWLIAINVTVFIFDVLFSRAGFRLAEIFGLSLDGIKSWHFWQPVTYMFMHGGVWHILMNMLGLYIFGTEFERHFGRHRFFEFYAICGFVGGLSYLALGIINPFYAYIPLVGASGAVYGLLIAAVIFFPHIRVVLFIFPMPIRVFGLIMAAILLLQLIGGGGVENAGGQVCHITGAVAGLIVLYTWGVMPRIRIGSGGGSPRRSRSEGAWSRKQKQLAAEQAEVDRILDKVSHHGIHSLSRRERRTLTRATQREKEREKELDRVHRF